MDSLTHDNIRKEVTSLNGVAQVNADAFKVDQCLEHCLGIIKLMVSCNDLDVNHLKQELSKNSLV